MGGTKKYIFVALVGYLIFKYIDVQDTPVISISTGDLVGVVSRTREGKEFFQFLGIPYGKPPVGNLRFEPPQPAQNWTGVRKAKSFGNMCMHINSITKKIEGDENCLFLNVFCPKFLPNEENGNKKLLPVIVYIHGGYFMAGGSNYMGPLYLLQEDVVLVTINYRLASLGFLNTGDGVIPGNMGMKDQVMALRFVQNEIKHFKGDPENVVIYGESAGSAAVNFHMLSPMSKGLFKKAIMGSGTAIKPWSLVNHPAEQAQLLGRNLNCPTENTTGLVECLKNLDSNTLIAAHMDALDSPVMDHLKIFAPSIELQSNDDSVEHFLVEHPYDILTQGRAHKVPLLTGVNAHEGLLATARMYFNTTLANEIVSNWDNLSPELFTYDENSKSITSKINDFYFGKSSKVSGLNFTQYFANFTNLFSDRWYIHSTKETVRIQSKFSPVYLYYFSYQLERSLTFFYDLTPNKPLSIQIAWKLISEHVNKLFYGISPLYLGTCHGDELVLLYNFPMVYIDVGEKDYEMSRLLINTIVQFAYDETQMYVDNTLWKPVKPKEKLQYMHFGSNAIMEGVHLVEEPFSNRMDFWDSLKLPWKLTT